MRSLSNLLKYEMVETSEVPYSVIKVGKTETPDNKPLAASYDRQALLGNAEKEAKKIIEKAKAYAAEVKKNAEIAAEITANSLYEEAKEQGYAEGLKIGKEDAEKKNLVALEEIRELSQAMEDEKSSLIASNKKNIIDMSYKIAEKVINQKLYSDDKLFLKLYEKAVKDLTAQKWLKLSVSESDVQIATSNSELLLSMVSGAERLQIEILDNAPKGTCIVETSEKIVDASVSIQLSVLKKATAEMK